MEVERREGSIHETRRPGRHRTEFIVPDKDTKSRPFRSQSAHRSAVAGYGFRHGRGCHHALERVEELLNAGNVYVVDADLKSYFDTISKPRLMTRIREKVSDSRVLRMLEMFLEQGVLDGLREWTPETGTPQGAVLSPLLANIYLQLRGWFTYFRHGHWSIFRDLDGWIRGRLRSILRKRQKRRGRGRGRDHQRWPNAFFGEQGLYSLNAAHVRFVQSAWR